MPWYLAILPSLRPPPEQRYPALGMDMGLGAGACFLHGDQGQGGTEDLLEDLEEGAMGVMVESMSKKA